MGENSPNLVTLVVSLSKRNRFFANFWREKICQIERVLLHKEAIKLKSCVFAKN
jgi:hypothetical protein